MKNVTFPSLIALCILLSCNNENQKKHIYYGIDVSHYQGDLLKEGLPESLSFVICKATEGTSFIDSDFQKNWQYLKQKKVKRGAYHFYIADENPIEQANHFLEALRINGYSSNDIAPIVDIEKLSLQADTNIDVNILNKNLLIFLNQVGSEISKKAIIYTNTSFANKSLIDIKISDHPLWIADYTKNSKPKIPNIWKKKGYLIWQKSNSYSFNSINVDFDLFKGNLNNL